MDSSRKIKTGMIYHEDSGVMNMKARKAYEALQAARKGKVYKVVQVADKTWKEIEITN